MTRFSKKIGSSRIIKENILYSGKWIEMVEFDYKDEENILRKYFC